MNDINKHQTNYDIDVSYAIIYETKLINKYQFIYLFIFVIDGQNPLQRSIDTRRNLRTNNLNHTKP